MLLKIYNMSNLQLLRKLPTLEELYSDNITEFNEKQSIMFLLNQEPKKEWLEVHPITRMLYMPIGRVEYLLNFLFPLWSVEVINTFLIANSVTVTVRLKLEFPDGNSRFFDGVGAAPLQTDAGSGATDFAKIKSSSVQMALPSAKSYAIKDAADHVGKIFGRDVNRKAMQQAAYEIITPEPLNSLSGSEENLLHDLKCVATDFLDVTELRDWYRTKILEIETPNLKKELEKFCTERAQILKNGK